MDQFLNLLFNIKEFTLYKFTNLLLHYGMKEAKIIQRERMGYVDLH
jgi:hypothetical protein